MKTEAVEIDEVRGCGGDNGVALVRLDEAEVRTIAALKSLVSV